jgi:hypothetical protein
MTVPSETKKSGPYTGNGVTTAFAYGFRILDASHIRVVRTENEIDTDVTTGFVVSGVGADSGGNVTFAVAPTALQKITLIRAVPFVQETDLENQGAYYAETIEAALDLAVMRDQQLQEQVDRSLKIPVGAPIAGTDEAIATLLAFGAIYLGASAVAPTERADGSPLTGGELYFDTAENGLSVYTGTAWNLLASTVNGTLSRQNYTATSGQTVFAINYDVGFVDVWLNGVKLVAGDDFTATNGTSITLTVGATLGDSVDIIAFGTFALADMLTKTANGADILDDGLFLTNLGFSAFVAGVRAAADAAAFRDAIGARSSAAITVADMDPDAVVTEAEGIAANDEDDRFPTAAAVVDYASKAWTKLAPVATTSGAVINIATGIPAGVDEIDIYLRGPSTNGTANFLVQVSVGGVFVTTGYDSMSGLAGNTAQAASTAGFVMFSNQAIYGFKGAMRLRRVSGNVWVSEHNAGSVPGVGTASNGGGDVSLAGALDGIRVTTTTGTPVFDAGEIIVWYR